MRGRSPHLLAAVTDKNHNISCLLSFSGMNAYLPKARDTHTHHACHRRGWLTYGAAMRQADDPNTAGGLDRMSWGGGNGRGGW